MQNIFQGNKLIKRTIAKSLGYDEDQKDSWFTENIYFQTFFYLSKRFGEPSRFDEYKEAGAWTFKVKEFIIQVRLNSSWVEFCMYGKIGNIEIHSPYQVKQHRLWIKNRDKLISMVGKWNKIEKEIAEKLFEKFIEDNQINTEMSQGEFDENFGLEWYETINYYNNSVLDIDYKQFSEKYGELYQNSYTRHALRTLDQFLKNMLTPIWVRDCPFNLKGRINDSEAMYFERYKNNTTIESINQ